VKAVFIGVIISVLVSPSAYAEEAQWERYQDQKHGYSFLFPADLLKPLENAPRENGIEFLSRNGQTKLKVLALQNADGVTPSQYRELIFREIGGYGDIRYGPQGQNWFVLSGFRGPNIYYQKIIFSCGGRMINGFALTYPRYLRRDYDYIVTKIEKNFHAVSGEYCPNR
jgi:hypothetical protein